ncbi:unnamed protein product [Amoebophrya sp. A120]|nr:unnamed protein product [Amoebophrya sp. A120]|eukprot:GSA120T00011076001.1
MSDKSGTKTTTGDDACRALQRRPDRVQMEYIGMDIVRFEKTQERRSFCFLTEECCIVPQNVRGVKVSVTEADGKTRTHFTLHGRRSPCLELTDFLYIGKGAEFTIQVDHQQHHLHTTTKIGTTENGPRANAKLPTAMNAETPTVCICRAFCDKVLPAKYGPVSGISIELRGRGQASRQVNNFMSPMTWKHADKLCCVEVQVKLITPDGNWSSYPPHKHDETGDGAINEEIYFFQIEKVPDMVAVATDLHADPFISSSSSTSQQSSYTEEPKGSPYAFHRTFTSDGTVSDTVTVFPQDVYLVPKGYHGPCVTPPGYNLYYLNVLSGPNPERTMQFCWHVEQQWLVQNQWRNLAGDRRLPLCANDVCPELHREVAVFARGEAETGGIEALKEQNCSTSAIDGARNGSSSFKIVDYTAASSLLVDPSKGHASNSASRSSLATRSSSTLPAGETEQVDTGRSVSPILASLENKAASVIVLFDDLMPVVRELQQPPEEERQTVLSRSLALLAADFGKRSIELADRKIPVIGVWEAESMLTPTGGGSNTSSLPVASSTSRSLLFTPGEQIPTSAPTFRLALATLDRLWILLGTTSSSAGTTMTIESASEEQILVEKVVEQLLALLGTANASNCTSTTSSNSSCKKSARSSSRGFPQLGQHQRVLVFTPYRVLDFSKFAQREVRIAPISSSAAGGVETVTTSTNRDFVGTSTAASVWTSPLSFHLAELSGCDLEAWAAARTSRGQSKNSGTITKNHVENEQPTTTFGSSAGNKINSTAQQALSRL